MQGQNFVAIYTTRAEAERARERLRREGVGDADMRLSAERDGAAATTTATGTDNPLAPKREEGFFDWLFGTDDDVPERDRAWYGTNLRDGRTALSVHVSGAVAEARVIAVLEEFGPIDIDDESWQGQSSVGQSSVGGASVGRASVGQAGAGARSAASGGQPIPAVRDQDMPAVKDQVIPVVKEELEIGKRQEERRYRVRSYAVERPVEQQVTLRDE